jgi:hypothetical protein
MASLLTITLKDGTHKVVRQLGPSWSFHDYPQYRLAWHYNINNDELWQGIIYSLTDRKTGLRVSCGSTRHFASLQAYKKIRNHERIVRLWNKSLKN